MRETLKNHIKRVHKITRKKVGLIVGHIGYHKQMTDEYIKRLMINSDISLGVKLNTINDPIKKDYWSSLLTASNENDDWRNRYNIDIEHHLKHFDPTGKTNGCGCTLCGMHRRVTKESKKLKYYSSILQFAELVKKFKKDKLNIDSISFITFKESNRYAAKKIDEFKDLSISELNNVIKDYKIKIETLSNTLKKHKVLLSKLKLNLKLPIKRRIVIV